MLVSRIYFVVCLRVTPYTTNHLITFSIHYFKFAVMEKKKETRQFVNEPEIQNLRWFLKQYVENDVRHTLEGFALSMDMTSRELGRYLRGEHKPRRKTIEKWGELFGVDYTYMTTYHCEFIKYSFETYVKPKQSGHHITKREVRQSYDDMIDEYETMAREGEVEYNAKVVDLMKRHKI